MEYVPSDWVYTQIIGRCSVCYPVVKKMPQRPGLGSDSCQMLSNTKYWIDGRWTKYEYGALAEWLWQGKIEVLGERPECHFSYQKCFVDWPDIEPSLSGERPATKRLSTTPSLCRRSALECIYNADGWSEKSHTAAWSATGISGRRASVLDNLGLLHRHTSHEMKRIEIFVLFSVVLVALLAVPQTHGRPYR